MPYRDGDQVTVIPLDTDPILLHMQRYATVVGPGTTSRCTIRIDDTVPPGQMFDIAPERLLPGWRNPATGTWRQW